MSFALTTIFCSHRKRHVEKIGHLVDCGKSSGCTSAANHLGSPNMLDRSRPISAFALYGRLHGLPGYGKGPSRMAARPGAGIVTVAPAGT